MVIYYLAPVSRNPAYPVQNHHLSTDYADFWMRILYVARTCGESGAGIHESAPDEQNGISVICGNLRNLWTLTINADCPNARKAV
jgi:hypothetical protein